MCLLGVLPSIHGTITCSWSSVKTLCFMFKSATLFLTHFDTLLNAPGPPSKALAASNCFFTERSVEWHPKGTALSSTFKIKGLAVKINPHNCTSHFTLAGENRLAPSQLKVSHTNTYEQSGVLQAQCVVRGPCQPSRSGDLGGVGVLGAEQRVSVCVE